MYHKMNMSQQGDVAAKEANDILASISKTADSKLWEVVFLLCVEQTFNLEYCVQFWAPNFRNYSDRLEQVQKKSMFNLWEDMMFKYLKGFNMQEGTNLF